MIIFFIHKRKYLITGALQRQNEQYFAGYVISCESMILILFKSTNLKYFKEEKMLLMLFM